MHTPPPLLRGLVAQTWPSWTGMVMLQRPAHASDRPDLTLLERVLYGWRSI
jgi:hypothetical protein